MEHRPYGVGYAGVLGHEMNFWAKDLWPPRAPTPTPWTTPSGRTLSQDLARFAPRTSPP
ncbi:Uncharacterized protein FKW44_007927 [Caligus rogercresseyi]|uniref:Uncharacterized protein n=1 Tax=Caligus rogercresseyi TaxID=217165 RepID=A0A7T8KFE7_CALRO|nr:Uncharacterized protein FKW44_007927 [Caligus rogercresseyi]